MLDTISYAAAIARIQTVGTLLGVSVDRLLASVGENKDGSAQRLRVWISDGFDRVAVFAAAPGGARRAERFGENSDAVLASAIPALDARPGQLFVELETDPAGLAVEVQALGRGAIDDDLARLRSVAPVGDATHAVLAQRAAELAVGGRSAGLSARFEPPATRQWALHVALADALPVARDALSRVASGLGVTAPQRNLIAALHPVLGARSAAVATLRMGPGLVYPELVVTYHDVAFEPVIRILIGIHPGVDVARRLGSVAGACNAERAAALAIHLRDREPVGLRIAFDLEQGG